MIMTKTEVHASQDMKLSVKVNCPINNGHAVLLCVESVF